jgi:hypothetical protein
MASFGRGVESVSDELVQLSCRAIWLQLERGSIRAASVAWTRPVAGGARR